MNTPTPTLTTSQDIVAKMQYNPAITFWLRAVAAQLIKRDPVDALKDARVLLELAIQMCKDAGQDPTKE